MNAATVESRLTIQPPIPGRFTWNETTLTFQPLEPWPEGETVTVNLEAGAQSVRFLPMLQGRTWSFTIGSSRIIYLWPAGSPADLYAITPDEGETARLTETPLGVLDYALNAEGSRIVYATARADGGSDLNLLDLTSEEDRLVYACPEGALCQELALDPGGKLLAFERRDFTVGAAGKPVLGASQVWAIAVEGEAEDFPVGPADHVTSTPHWSPSGWLAYYDSTLRAIALVDLSVGGEPQPFNYIPYDLGLEGSWSPEGDFLLLPEIVFPEIAPAEGEVVNEASPFYSHLYRVEAASGLTMDLTGGLGGRVEDASPAYAPNGEWIAFTRKYLDADRWSLGRQLWLMRPDGSGARQLTIEPFFGFSSLDWSPDSTKLVFMRKNQVDIGQPAEIWLYEVEGGEFKRLVAGGYLPRWIP